MHVAWSIIAQVNHLHPEHGQDVGDEPPVTAPPEHLGAHDDGAKAGGQHEELVETLGKFLRADMVRIGLEGGMPPAEIDRVGVGAAPAAERRDPVIGDAGQRKIVLESGRRKMRESPGAGKSPDVGNELDIMCHEQPAKLVAGSCGVTDRPDGERHGRTIAALNRRRQPPAGADSRFPSAAARLRSSARTPPIAGPPASETRPGTTPAPHRAPRRVRRTSQRASSWR